MSYQDKVKSDMMGNWYDIIGWNIANQGHYTSGWENVVHTLCAESLGRLFLKGLTITVTEKQISTLQCAENFYKPYLELIQHWAAKGYQPKQIKE